MQRGRQLFVDNYLVQWTNASRTFHRAASQGVVLEPKPWEWQHQGAKFSRSMLGFHLVGTARPFSGGVHWDSCRQSFVMHYRCRYLYSGRGRGCVAFSADGRNWIRPVLNKLKGPRHAVEPSGMSKLPNAVNCADDTEAFTTLIDHEEQDLRHRWKAVSRQRSNVAGLKLWSSPDGVTWSALPNKVTGQVTDRASFFYNPWRRRFVFSIRENLCRGGHGHMRISRYMESDSLLRAHWPKWVQSYFQCTKVSDGEPVRWIGVDRDDCEGSPECDLYHVDATPYESLLVGQFAVLYPGYAHGSCKDSFVHLAFSRDGFHWSRVTPNPGAPRLPIVDDKLALRYQQPIAGNLLAVGDELYLYYGGARRCKRCNQNPDGLPGVTTGHNKSRAFCLEGDAERDGPVTPNSSSMEEITALAVFRRDGFASLAPHPERPFVVVLTRPLLFHKPAAHLFVNVDATHGELLVSVCDADGETAAPTHFARSMKGINSTRTRVRWRGPKDISWLRGHRFRLRFDLYGSARLFAFWVSATTTGESRGYVNGPAQPHGVDDGRSSSDLCAVKRTHNEDRAERALPWFHSFKTNCTRTGCGVDVQAGRVQNAWAADYRAKEGNFQRYQGVLGRCAVVSSSPALLGKHYGADIDSHDSVIRFNFPPMEMRYAIDVGSTTSLIFGHASNLVTPKLGDNGRAHADRIVEAFAAKLTAYRRTFMERGAALPSVLMTNMCAKCTTYSLDCAASKCASSVAKGLHGCDVHNFSCFVINLQLLRAAYTAYLSAFKAPIRGQKPSSGWIALHWAKLTCRKVDAYGFAVSSSRSGHYYQEASASLRDEARGKKHDLTSENAWMRAAFAGQVTFFPP